MSKRNKHIIGLILGLLLMMLFTWALKSCDSTVKLPSFDNNISTDVSVAARNVDEMIGAIATPISLDSEDAILRARAAYDALSDSDKAKVTLLDKLKGFELDLSNLKAAGGTGDLIADNAADLDSLLAGIKLPLNAEGFDLLSKIRVAFDKLSPEEKIKFKGLNLLEGFELASQGGASLDNLLNGISLPIKVEDADLLARIRAAYDALSDDEKAKFTGIDKLNAYEIELNNLLAGGGVDAVNDLIKSIATPITLNSEEAINKALAAYNSLSDADKAKVSNYNLLQDYLNQLNALKDGANLPVTGVE